MLRDVGRLGASAGLWGPAAFTSAAALGARRVAGYSHRRDHISGLAARRVASARVMIPGFVALGVAQTIQPHDDPLVERLLRTAGAATIVAGVVQCSSVACPMPVVDDDATTGDAVHAVASVTGFTIWTVLPWITATRAGPRWYRRTSAGCAAAASVAYVASAVSTGRRSSPRGLVQRMFLAPVFVWFAATSVRGLRSGQPRRSISPRT